MGYTSGKLKGKEIRDMREGIRQEGLREGVKIPGKRRWHSLIDKIWAMPNLEEAFREVKRNRGAAGVDGVTIKAFESEDIYNEHHPQRG